MKQRNSKTYLVDEVPFFNIQNWNLFKSIWNRIRGLRRIYVFIFSVTLSHAANKWKTLNHQISYDKKKLKLQNTNAKKYWTHKKPTRKMFGPTKYPQEKCLDPQNTHKKKIWNHEIPTWKILEPTKYPWEMILDPAKYSRDPRWHTAR